jgi:hypothetical protein
MENGTDLEIIKSEEEEMHWRRVVDKYHPTKEHREPFVGRKKKWE